MMGPRVILVQGLIAGLLTATLAAGGFIAYVAWYTGGERIIPGVRVGGAPVGGMTPPKAQIAVAGGPAPGGETQVGSEAMTLGLGEKRWAFSRRELEALPDLSSALERAQMLGRNGPLWVRAWTFASTWVRGRFIPVEISVKEELLSKQLLEIAREVHLDPTDASYDAHSGRVTESQPGRSLDYHATLQAVRTGLMTGKGHVDAVVRPLLPSLQSQEVQQAKQHVLSRFTTDILAADDGRVHNISTAVAKISGAVIRPGEIFSFNQVVGPRDGDHGWALATEIYNGEFVTGYGGGICQVSTTLYNAVLLAGLTVVERSHHSRPLAYIHPGRDATVAWDSVDFKFRNGFGQPIILAARVLPPARKGAPQQIEISLLSSRPRTVEVHLESGDERFQAPENVEVTDPTLTAGERVVVDEGYYGIDVKTFRVLSERQGQTVRELVSHDRYLPKPGKVLVGTGRRAASPPLTH